MASQKAALFVLRVPACLNLSDSVSFCGTPLENETLNEKKIAHIYSSHSEDLLVTV